MDSYEELVVELHKYNLTANNIADYLGVGHPKVRRIYKKLGMETNKKGSPTTLLVFPDGNTALCEDCNTYLPLSSFRKQRQGNYSLRLSRCNKCRLNRLHSKINSNVESYLASKIYIIRSRCRIRGIPFSLSKDQLVDMWYEQRGLCFYTDKELRTVVGEGVEHNSLSLDRVIPSLGYTYENLVICTNRVNTIKNDLSLEEMEQWTPNWFQRAKCFIETGKRNLYAGSKYSEQPRV